MPKKRTTIKEKEPSSGRTDESSKDLSQANNSTSETNLSTDDNQRGRHFWYVVYPSKEWIEENQQDCEYDGAEGWGTAPDDWREQLTQAGYTFCVSPLHYLDVNPDGKIKKPHWHVIISWGNTTTLRTAELVADNILHSPTPKMLSSVIGAYRYHKHLDNPEKHQYEEESKAYNGWERPIDNNEKTRIKAEIMQMIFADDIREYSELLIECAMKGPEYFDVASNSTLYCNTICTSYRHDPLRALHRYYETLPDGDVKETIRQRIICLNTED